MTRQQIQVTRVESATNLAANVDTLILMHAKPDIAGDHIDDAAMDRRMGR